MNAPVDATSTNIPIILEATNFFLRLLHQKQTASIRNRARYYSFQNFIFGSKDEVIISVSSMAMGISNDHFRT